MQPKLPFCPNDEAFPKSSHHEDFGNVLTFGWFGDAFFVMSVQNFAILADPISTFYKLGIIGSKKRPLATTTQNTKHTTTNMSRCRPTPQRFCPLPPWEGQQRRQLMVPRLPKYPRNEPVPAVRSTQLVPLFGVSKRDPSKNIEMREELALGGHC